MNVNMNKKENKYKKFKEKRKKMREKKTKREGGIRLIVFVIYLE